MTFETLESRVTQRSPIVRNTLKGILGFLGAALVAAPLYAQTSDKPIEESNYSGDGAVSAYQNPGQSRISFENFMRVYTHDNRIPVSDSQRQKSEQKFTNSDDNYKEQVYLAYSNEDEFCRKFLTEAQTQDYKALKNAVENWVKSEKLKAYDKRRKGQSYQRQPINIFKPGVSRQVLSQEYSRAYPWIEDPTSGENLLLVYYNELGKNRIDQGIKSRTYSAPRIIMH
ncbi:Uncharacterised protein [uncultured archaeon]|nr:Uncharacterised protein [uncultured archaeon]